MLKKLKGMLNDYRFHLKKIDIIADFVIALMLGIVFVWFSCGDVSLLGPRDGIVLTVILIVFIIFVVLTIFDIIWYRRYSIHSDANDYEKDEAKAAEAITDQK